MTYNLANQLTSESFVGGNLNGLLITNAYDYCLRRTNLTALNSSSPIVSDSFGYDAASRLSAVSDQNNNSATYSYLANSPMVSQITFKQNGVTRMTTTKQYDFLNRLTQISSTPSASYVAPAAFNYNYNSANQRTKNTLADGSYWVYGYDSLGQVTNGCKFFSNGTPVPGQKFDYTFDAIGNRTQTMSGGDTNGANLRVANYYANNLNQLTNRDIPPYLDVMGASILTNTVTVNGQVAYRNQEYFRQQLPANNTNYALWTNVLVSGGQSVSGNLYVPQEPEVLQYDADGNLTNDGRWQYIWDGENRLVEIVVNTNVGPQYTNTFAYDPSGRRIQKVTMTNGATSTTLNYLYDGWNVVAVLSPTLSPVNTFMWGSDLSGSMHRAGGVGGLLEVTYCATPSTNCVPAFDGNGNVMDLVNVTDGSLAAQYDYAPFGELLRATGPMAKLNPFRFASQYDDDESDIVWYPRRPYNPSTGRWLSRDPIEEEGGENLYIFCGNDSLNNWDLLGEKWKVDRSGGAKASAMPEQGDTVASLATMIGLNASEYQMWLTADSGTAMPGSSGQAMGGCEHFEVPNTVVAYWAGNLGWFGRWWVHWNSSVKYLGSLGFKVENHHHQKGDSWGLMKMFIPASAGKELQGVYFWGHGSAPYPATYLVSDSGDVVLQFSQPGLTYHMGLGLVFACDSNSGKSSLMSDDGIWKGFTGTLVPWPFRAYHARDYIHHGDQATH